MYRQVPRNRRGEVGSRATVNDPRRVPIRSAAGRSAAAPRRAVSTVTSDPASASAGAR